MGCIHSKNEFLYRVYFEDSPGNLEINSKEITLYRKNLEPTKWMLQHLRRYGFDPETEVFTFEAGRRCPTGEGIYTFRCHRAESLFHLLQSYIQQTDINSQQQQQQNVNNDQNSRPRSLHTPNSLNSSSNYIIPSTITRPTLIRNGTTTTISHSSDTLNFDSEENNYLEPTPAMRSAIMQQRSGIRLNSIDSLPMSPLTAEPHSPGSPSSLNRILELTQLNEPHHHHTFQNSNLYQEYPIKSEYNNNNNNHNNNHNINHNNNNNNNNTTNTINNSNELNRKLSLDIPPQEQAPTIIATTNQPQTSPSHQLLSPLSPQDPDRTYVNITPGEIMGTPTSSGLSYFPRSLTQSAIDSSTRCYENLEPSEIRTHLMQQNIQSPTTAGATSQLPHLNAATVIFNRNARYSKPDIFSKTDLLMSSFEKSSEPSTPTSLKIQQQQLQNKTSLSKDSQENHKVNYIVLDLDNSPSSNTEDSSSQQDPPSLSVSKITVSQNTSNNNNCNTIAINSNSNNTNTGTLTKISTSINNKLNNGGLLSPDSPKISNNSAQTLGYATIDFNKTAALHNSTAPVADNDNSSRKTRHSATRHSNSISE